MPTNPIPPELVARLTMIHDLIQEAKGFEGEQGGPITDHLDSAEVILDEVEEELAALINPSPPEREAVAQDTLIERCAQALAKRQFPDHEDKPDTMPLWWSYTDEAVVAVDAILSLLK